MTELKKYLKYYAISSVYSLFRLIPVKKNRVFFQSYEGRRYADNPKVISEQLMSLNQDIEVCWLCNSDLDCDVPKEIKKVSRHNLFQTLYAYATSRVLVANSCLPLAFKKKSSQIVIDTWHGGLGIKKIGKDRKSATKFGRKRGRHGFDITDVLISNSNHLSKIYREDFRYKGPIWKCGYPKNDVFFCNKTDTRNKIREQFGLEKDCNILIYAPTFRSRASKKGEIDMSPYDIDYSMLCSTLQKTYGGKWMIFLKYHPLLQNSIKKSKDLPSYIIDVTSYNDIQELIMASDALISDYSSCIFDAAFAGLKCFIYANDFDKYKKENGVYYELSELPFSYATDNKELNEIVMKYDSTIFAKKWKDFTSRVGLVETGYAGRDIAKKIVECTRFDDVIWENTDI